MSTVKNSQVFALFFTLLFCFFMVPVMAQDAPANTGGSNYMSKVFEYLKTFGTKGYKYVMDHRQQIWVFTKEKVWPLSQKIAKAIWGAIQNKTKAAAGGAQ